MQVNASSKRWVKLQRLKVSGEKKGFQTKAKLFYFLPVLLAEAAIELVHLVLDCLAPREPARRLPVTDICME